MPRAFLLTNRRYKSDSISSDGEHGFETYDIIKGDKEWTRDEIKYERITPSPDDQVIYEKHLPAHEAESRSFAARAILHLGLDLSNYATKESSIVRTSTQCLSPNNQHPVTTRIPHIIPMPPPYNTNWFFSSTLPQQNVPHSGFDYRMETLLAKDQKTTRANDHIHQSLIGLDEQHLEFHNVPVIGDSSSDLSIDCTPPTSPESTIPSDSGETFPCDLCEKSYSTSSNLARHRQTHRSLDDKKARKCPHCEKVYVSMPAYSMHVRTHAQGCKCPYCGKNFSRPWLLQGHIRTHTGEKPFACNICSKSFADKSNLRAHIQTHSSLKPFTCGRCGKAFALKSYLYKHEESSCMRGQRSLLKKQRQRQRLLATQSAGTDVQQTVPIPMPQ